MDFKELLQTDKYDFLRNDPHLGQRIMLLGIGGSYGYGTEREGSDVDFRGITLNLPSELIGLKSYEQFEDHATDTVIYTFNKFIRLVLDCNPNTIEILGLDKDQYYIMSAHGKELLDNRGLFLSKRAAASFGHYAEAQLRRLQNAIARDSLPQPDREKHILHSVTHALEDFNRKHSGKGGNSIRLYTDIAETEGLESEIFMDADLKHYPLRSYTEMMNAMVSVIREYSRIGGRNKKKDDNHLNKHAMHLIRLFMMGIDILEKGEIRTHRPETDLAILRSIRNGEFMNDSCLSKDFFDLVSEYEHMFEEAEKKSELPENPDMDRVGRFVERVNRYVILEDA